MITAQEKSQIRQIIQSPQWSTIERFANLVCQNIESNSSVRDSEWDTIKATLEQSGQVQGIRRFIQELYDCLK